ncbi:MAG: transporter substrate-binding domain-containing protein [Halopseudomonas aestusnigri]
MPIYKLLATISYLLLFQLSSVANAEKPIILTTHNLPPYSYFDEDLNLIGSAIGVVRCVFQRSNIPLEIRVMPWKRAQKLVSRNEVDGFFAASQNAERDEFAVISDYIADQDWVWYIRRDSSFDPKSEKFKNEAIVSSFFGANMHKWLVDNQYRVLDKPPPTTEHLLRMLTSKRLDGILANNQVMSKLLEEGQSEVRRIVHKKKPLGVYFSKHFLSSRPDFLKMFNSHVKYCRKNPRPPAKVIRFITYHISEPFIIDTEAQLGLTYELARYLTKKSEGRFQFHVETFSRPELNEQIAREGDVVVPWVNPVWFRDVNQEKYLWTSGYFEDSNSFVSSRINPIEYNGPKSLEGLILAGLRGGRWVGLEEPINSGMIIRKDMDSYWQATRAVVVNKVDVAIIPTSVARHFLIRHGLTYKLHFAAKKHSRYQRHLLIKNNHTLHKYLQAQILLLKNSQEWKAILSQFGL